MRSSDRLQTSRRAPSNRKLPLICTAVGAQHPLSSLNHHRKDPRRSLPGFSASYSLSLRSPSSLNRRNCGTISMQRRSPPSLPRRNRKGRNSEYRSSAGSWVWGIDFSSLFCLYIVTVPPMLILFYCFPSLDLRRYHCFGQRVKFLGTFSVFPLHRSVLGFWIGTL